MLIPPMGYSTTVLVHVLFILLPVLPHQALHLHTGHNTDEMALLAFRKGIQDSENVLSNWNDSTYFCDWIGIFCSQGSVSRLVLSHLSLHGTISPFLSNLSQLRVLDLSDNFLHGSIPVELGVLSGLIVLSLSNNELQHGIPDGFSMLEELKYFDLSANKLDGKLPTSIFYNCTQLTDVDLSNNSFDGPIPPEIGTYLNGLEYLLLSWNSLTGSIPNSLCNATITTIALDGNFLSGKLPSDIVAHMPLLQSLSVSYNNLSSGEQDKDLDHFFSAISNLTDLQYIGLAGNGLRGTLPLMTGLLHVNLSQIFLQENKIHGTIPSNISNLQNLTTLNLSQNLLEGTIPLGLFLLPNIERIWINDNLLHGEIPSLPDVSSKLGSLDLSRNKLSGNIPSSISKLSSIRFLLLSGNLFVGSIPSSLGSMNLELLDLSHNQLTGAIPDEVASLSTIARYFNLSHNLLEGTLPWELSKMDMVQAIVLSSNNFNGCIPPDMGSCRSIELLNLSHNSLHGPIPETFGNLQILESLDLSSNFLSGEVPGSLQHCTSLKQLNLSFNQLTGPLPHGGIFDSLTFQSLEGNNVCGLGGFPSCKLRRRNITHSHKFLVLLASIVSFVALFFLTIFCVTAVKRIRGTAFIRNGVDVNRHSVLNGHRRITYRELWEATGGFDQSRLIGSGGFGDVYRAALRDDSLVAIKVLHLQDHNSARTFNRECQVLKRIRHRNLMGIITVCSLPEFKALVLPFMSKGSLEHHLYPQGDQTDSLLSLTDRVNICSDVAEGMTYLHHHALVQVIHCDLKPSNILLSDDMTAIVSDFGISRLVSTVAEGNASSDSMTNSTANLLRGSVGYVAPEYGYGGSASAKGDVYSFGIVVLEMVTGKRPTDDMFDEGLSLINWVKNQCGSQLENIVDSSLVRNLREQRPEVKKIWEVAIMEMIELGLLCTQEVPSTRPTMISVADDLNKLKHYLGGDTTATFTSSHGMSTITDTEDDW